MITISWIIERMAVAPKSGDLENVIVTADWRANASDDAGNKATAYGSATFAAPAADSMKPFEDVQLEDVLEWVLASGVDRAGVEANLAKQIADQVNPPLVIVYPQWVPKTVAPEAPADNVAAEPPTKEISATE